MSSNAEAATRPPLPAPHLVNPDRVLAILASTHPDAVAAATYRVAYEELAADVKRERAAFAEQLTKSDAPEDAPDAAREPDAVAADAPG